MPRQQSRTVLPRAPATPDVEWRMGPVNIARVADIASRPFELAGVKLSNEHKCALFIARMCMLDALGASAPTAHVVYDEKAGECAVMNIHPTLARVVLDNLDTDPEDDDKDDVAPMHCAMCIVPLHGTDKLTLFFVRSAAWEWVESWCGTHARPASRLLRKITEEIRFELPGDDESGWMFGWANLLKHMPNRVCARCGLPGTRACLGVHCVAQYCSRECQTAHWRVHKALCQSRPPNATMARLDARALTAFLAGDDRGDEFCRQLLHLTDKREMTNDK